MLASENCLNIIQPSSDIITYNPAESLLFFEDFIKISIYHLEDTAYTIEYRLVQEIDE